MRSGSGRRNWHAGARCSGTVSAFNGPAPQVETFASPEIERAAVAEWTQDLIEDGLAAHEIGVFVRSRREMVRNGGS